MSILNFNKKLDLIIIDDYYPNLLTGFRVAEYNNYLKVFNNSRVYSSAENFEEALHDFGGLYPQFKSRVLKFDSNRKFKTKLFYTVFLNNAFNYLDFFEKNQTSFIFTLYPGGGFWLDSDEVDYKLRKIFSSKYFKKVIVTQTITKEYLLRKKLCKPGEIEFIFGVVTDSDFYNDNVVKKQRYPEQKPTFDIAFVAHKYMTKGVDKGYDTFIDVAKKLSKQYNNIRFHIVGNFDETDIDISIIRDKVIFYGSQGIHFFPNFYSGIELILSPTVPFKLYPGNFDGFPTGCCTDAALLGSAVFTSDPLNLNIYFKNKKEIEIIPLEVSDITDIIEHYYKQPKSLYTLSLKGQERFRSVYSIKNQMLKRLETIEHEINKQ